MYVIQSGSVAVIDESGGEELELATLEAGDFFGEMAIFEGQARSATIRAKGEARVLTVDRRTLMRRIQNDPTIAFNLLQTLCRRIRRLDAELTRAKQRQASTIPSGGN
jgi:CRP/FNR family transcriptional regulator